MFRTKAVVLGTGGHAKVIVDILEQSGQIEIAGFTSAETDGQEFLGYPILGTDEFLPQAYEGLIRHAFSALGANLARKQTMQVLDSIGFELINAISPQSVISPNAKLGRGIAVMPGAVINAGAEIGDGAIINTGALIDHDCRIGKFVHVAPGCALAGCVHIGDGAFLGVGARIVPGVRIGAWSIVGAGGVVIRDLEEEVTAVGVPVKVIKRNSN